MAYRATVVTIDDDYLLPALIDPDGRRWNGWECPLFPMSSVLSLRDRLEEEREYDPEGPRIAVEGERVTLYPRTDQDPDDEPSVYEPVMVEGVAHWPVGAMEWTWSLASYDCGDCGAALVWHEIGLDLTRTGVDPVPVVLCAACAEGGE
jgi:hypothetical protein